LVSASQEAQFGGGFADVGLRGAYQVREELGFFQVARFAEEGCFASKTNFGQATRFAQEDCFISKTRFAQEIGFAQEEGLRCRRSPKAACGENQEG
jgi:hypothetical protein